MTPARRRIAALACALGATLLPATAARAASDAAGYTSKGQLVVRTSLGGAGNEITLGGDIALEERGGFVRIDLVSLAIPGTDATVSSLLSTQLFPPGGFTIVYDRAAGTYTVWSPSKHDYFTSAASGTAPAKAAGNATPAATAALGAAGDLFGAFGIASSLKNDSAFTASVSLAGHGTVNGHPATGLDYQYARTTTAGESTEIHGRFPTRRRPRFGSRANHRERKGQVVSAKFAAARSHVARERTRRRRRLPRPRRLYARGDARRRHRQDATGLTAADAPSRGSTTRGGRPRFPWPA